MSRSGWVQAWAMVCAGAYPPLASAASVAGVAYRDAFPPFPLSGARVTLFDEALNFFREARTDQQGEYEFASVPPGVYRLGASALNLEYQEVGIEVVSGDVARSFTLGPETNPGRWTIVGNTLPEFFDATDIAILRADGKVFYCHDTVDPVLFDPATGQKSSPAGSSSEQGCMSGTVLLDGRILMAGGQDGDDPGNFRNAVRWVKTYSPATNNWQSLPDLLNPTGRWYPGLARLSDGSLLIMGGGTRPNAQRTNTCERFDPASQTWSYTGSMVNPCEFPPSGLLFTGEVLATWWPPQLYSPSSGQWRQTGNFVQPNRGWPDHSDHSLVVLSDGRALAIGVRKGPDGNTRIGEIYDPVTGQWSLTSNPGLVRFQTEVVQLPDGRVLVAGGETQVSPVPVPSVLGIVKWSDLYDAAKESWRRVADLNVFREYHAVTLLVPDGRVLTTGGTRIKFKYGPTSANIEAFEPPYLFRGVRPKIESVSSTTLRRGSRITANIAPTMQITSLVLMGTAATTHWVDGGTPRRLVLPMSQSAQTVAADLPVNPNVLPAGHYILFAMVDDIPSVGVIIRVDVGPPRSPGDFDSDGDVDQDDLTIFRACMTGPGLGPTVSGCARADLDGDSDADQSDFGLFQRCLSGSGVSASPSCDVP